MEKFLNKHQKKSLNTIEMIENLNYNNIKNF